MRINNCKSRSFAADTRGNVAILTALSIIPCLLLVGTSIDYGRALAVKATMQDITDAAALTVATGLTLNTTAAQAQTTAQTYINGASPKFTMTLAGPPTLSNNNAQVCLTTQTNVPTTLMRLTTIQFLPISTSSCVTAQSGGPFEIALVLDNTGSMAETSSGNTKLSSAQTAATSLIAQLNAPNQPITASFSIVPFSTSVNVGTTYANASWMDTGGKSSYHWQNYTRPSGTAWLPTSRFDMYSQMGVSWAGCVEERHDPYLVTDTKADPSNPDTLIVPYLWPDEADQDAGSSTGTVQLPYSGSDTPSNQYGSYNWSSWSSSRNNSDRSTPANNYLYDYGGSCKVKATNAYVVADSNDPISKGSGATMLCKYKGTSGSVSASTTSNGPNQGCQMLPLQTLTTDNTVLNSKINAMTAAGNTNLLPGFMWGWRTISPNGPFTTSSTATVGPQNPKAYNAPNNTKVIVLMTDGFNTWSTNSNYPYKSEYNALGYFKNNLLSAYGGTTYPTPQNATGYAGSTDSTNWRYQMDAALLQACTNAKTAGVLIYTVGFSIPSDPIDQEGLALLQKCATDSSKAFVATDANAFLAAFKAIGTGLSNLRIKS